MDLITNFELLRVLLSTILGVLVNTVSKILVIFNVLCFPREHVKVKVKVGVL